MYPYGFPKEPETPKGLRWCMAAFAVYVVMMIFQLVFGAWISITLSGVMSTTPTSQVSSLLVMALLLALITGIVGTLALIFYFIGFGHMYAGREELGAKHSRNMWISLILIISAVVAYGIGSMSQMFISMSVYGSSYDTIEMTKDLLTKEMIASSISGVVIAALVAAALSLSVLALIAPGRKPLIFAAAAVGTATPGIAGAIGLIQVEGIVDRLYRSSGASFDASIGLPTIISAVLGIITFLIFLLIYYSVHTAIKTGQLRPIARQPTPVWTQAPYYIPVMPYQPAQPQYTPPPQPQPPTPPRTQP